MAQFREIPGFPVYEISEFGTVRNKETGTVLRCGINNGYPQISLVSGSERLTRKINRLVAITFIGEPPTPKHLAAHNDGNPFNNHVSNIRWATSAENAADKKIHKTVHHLIADGETNSNSKLTAEQVQEIRKSNKRAKELAEIYGIKRNSIYGIKKYVTWQHI